MYKVLIVEPQEFSLNALLNLPVWNTEKDGREGFSCLMTARNGQEALELIQTHNFDLILTEINLAVCDGLQLLKQIHRNNQPPLVVFISDIVTFAYAREGFIYGAFDYLPKPVSRHDIEELFVRTADELEKMKKQRYSTDSHQNYRFSPTQINKVVNDFCHRNKKVIQSFQSLLHSLYDTPRKLPLNPDLMANKLFSSVVTEIYTQNNWLSLYIPQSFHEQLDYLELHNSDDYIAFYLRKFTYLFEQYCQLCPDFQDETIVKIHTYILSHPEEDLKLTTVANRFYLNHTYLSNLFSRKSHLRYSQLVTLAKMKRAEYLINFTDCPLIDISFQLGYKDFHYFLRLFKKTIGRSAAEYLRSEGDYNNYSI